jgi:hypothetical protein
MSALESFGDEIWIGSGAEVMSAGFRYPTRTVVIRLADGGLFVWSPVALSDALRADVDALGEVHFLVTPTAMHHLSLARWQAVYPRAVLYAAPRSRQRSLEIVFDNDLGDEPEPGWAGQIDQVIMRGNAIAEEVVFFHRRSGVVLFADLLQNFPKDWFSGWRAIVARMDGMICDEPRTPQKFRIAFTDRRAARESLAKVLAWPAEKVVMAHGTPVRENGAAYLKRAFRWLAR